MAPHSSTRLENPMDGGAWWAAVYGVAQSRTQLKRLSSSRLTVIFSQHFGNTSVSYNYFFFQVHCRFNCQSFTGDLSLGISGKLLDVISSNITSSLFHFLFTNSSTLNFFIVCVSQPLFYIYIYIYIFCLSVLQSD